MALNIIIHDEWKYRIYTRRYINKKLKLILCSSCLNNISPEKFRLIVTVNNVVGERLSRALRAIRDTIILVYAVFSVPRKIFIKSIFSNTYVDI